MITALEQRKGTPKHVFRKLNAINAFLRGNTMEVGEGLRGFPHGTNTINNVGIKNYNFRY